ncbi:protein of unknown function [Methylorubrum extorquens]|uniref:Uncharacterized protein n=1 Tax=Methylorubrum extorquens TaxID=408 RepID=A0A2N9AXH7_METEX|nr:protein of unknown function [Methylorubrum extorquens]
MTLSKELYEELLQNPCPSCGTLHIRAGRWFAIVSKYQCYQCDTTIFLTYPRKIELFHSHQSNKDKIET